MVALSPGPQLPAGGGGAGDAQPLAKKYEDQFGSSLLQFTIANTKEVFHQIVSSGLTPVMIRRHQDNLIDFCRLHTHCRVKNHWQLFERALKKTAQSNDIFFTSYEEPSFAQTVDGLPD